jgi:hypothetical protein
MYIKYFCAVMKCISILFIYMLAAVTAFAQESRSSSTRLNPMVPESVSQQVVNGENHHPSGVSERPVDNVYIANPSDSLHLPVLSSYNASPLYYPFGYWGGYGDWYLHPGFNMSLNASVMVGFGKYAPSGAGFSQNLSFMYAHALTKNISFAVGGYFNRLDWDYMRYNDAGISAVLGYHFNEHWDGYIYGQKSLLNTKSLPPYMRYMNNIGDRIGAMVQYHFSPSFYVSLSVDKVER